MRWFCHASSQHWTKSRLPWKGWWTIGLLNTEQKKRQIDFFSNDPLETQLTPPIWIQKRSIGEAKPNFPNRGNVRSNSTSLGSCSNFSWNKLIIFVFKENLIVGEEKNWLLKEPLTHAIRHSDFTKFFCWPHGIVVPSFHSPSLSLWQFRHSQDLNNWN